MKQIRFIPSGCQFWSKHIISAAGDYFAFCSTTAIYIVRMSDMQVEKILAGHDHTILSITWNPKDPNQLASCSFDGCLLIWDLEKERIITKKIIGAQPIQMEFAPLEDNLIAIVTEANDIKLCYWTQDKIEKLLTIDNSKLVRWNNVMAGRMVIGTKGGMLTFYNTKTKKSTKISPYGDVVLEDMQWDPNSQNYLLACWKDGSMSLIDADSGNEMQKFDKQGAGLTCISWLRSVPGGFVTCNDRISALKIWSVSNKSPLHTIKSGEAPLINILNIFNTSYAKDGFLLTFKNGSVGIFNYSKKALEFLTQPNHSETIFDMAFKPNNKDILATGSYDGSMKIWEINQMQCIMNLHKQNPNENPQNRNPNIIYSIAWAPGDINQIVSVSSKGEIRLWDTVKGKLLSENSPGSANPIYRVDWNTLNPNLIAVGHADGFVFILEVNNNTLSVNGKLKHPQSVFGVAWSPFNKNLLATACGDGGVRVWDYTKSLLLHDLKGHTAKSFNVAWNPMIPSILASGGDDNIIRVWDIKQGTVSVLTGHKSRVRGLVWNNELPWLLSSGSWDATIITWDVRDRTPIYVAKEHHADVYGIISHPQRPFVYVSCSRDTSLRFWTLEKVVTPLMLRVMITNDWDDIIGMPPTTLDTKSELLKLCGTVSRNVANEAGAISGDLVEYYEKIMNFFSYMDYQKEFWDISRANIKHKQEDSKNRVVSLANLPSLYLSQAQELESKGGASGFTYDALNKKSDRILEAASMYLKLGEFELYCEALVKLDKWETALAFAPAVSYEYWKSLAKRYAQELATAGSEQTGSYYLLSGQVSEAIKFYIDRGDYEDARLIAALKVNNKFGYLEASDRYQTKLKTSDSLKIDSQSFAGTEIREIISSLAEDAMKKNQPLLAASYHLSIYDASSAALKLLRANEPIYAFVLCQLYELNIQPQVYLTMAFKADKIGERFLGNILLNQLSNKAPLEIFCANSPLQRREANELYVQNNLSNVDKFEAEAQKYLEKGKVLEAVKYFVLGKNTQKACALAVDTAIDSLSNKKFERIAQLPEIFRILGYSQLNSLTDHKLKAEVIAFNLYFGLKKAIWKGYYPIVSLMLNIFKKYVEEMKQQINFPIDLQEVELEVVNFEALAIPEETYGKITNLFKSLQNSNYQASASNTAKNIKEVLGDESKPAIKHLLQNEVNKHKVYIPGNNLPTHVNPDDLPWSFLSRTPIKSDTFTLEDGKSKISIEEAMMWAECCMISPLLTGSLIMPY